MDSQRVDAIVVGADRVARNGDTANKIGTYQLAVLAKHHGIPFYVVCPLTTIDMVSKPIEGEKLSNCQAVPGQAGNLAVA